MQGAGIDTAGRLLLTTDDGTLVRWPSGGPADLTQPTGCGTGERSAVGPAPDGGFAVACRAGAPLRFTVTRSSVAGSPQWTSAGTADWPFTCCPLPADLDEPDLVTVDGADRAWVAGRAATTSDAAGGTLIESFSAAGPGPIAVDHMDDGHQNPHLISDLRSIDGGRVIYADWNTCCISIEGTFPYQSAIVGRLPRPPAAPTSMLRPAVTAADEASITVDVDPCDHPAINGEPSGYRIEVRDAAGGLLGTSTAGTGTDPIQRTVDGITGGRLVATTVTPFNAHGDGSHWPTGLAVPPFADVTSFAERQHQDLAAGGSATNSASAITAKTLTPVGLVDELLDTGLAHDHVEPVARLYRAFFLRDADPSGLAYWVRTHREGTRLATIATKFAASSEFQRRYGTLSNRAYVAKLYQNVFGRTADPSGLAYWTGRLDGKRSTRGQVVLQFSESSEGVRRSAPVVEPLATAWLMLGRLPTASERPTWAGLPDHHAGPAAAILASAEYADRVAAPA